jgi:uncharacterized protein YbbC (DUF1343 family)
MRHRIPSTAAARAPLVRSTLLLLLVPLALLLLCAGQARAQGAGGRVKTGIEVLLSDSIHLIRGKRVGLITNHTGVGADGRSSIDLLFTAPGVRLTALYGPEHGIRGVARAGDKVASSVDSATKVPVYSLYGDTRVPTPAMVKDVDILIFDIQEVGGRIYTYPWTMALSAEAAKSRSSCWTVPI